MPDNMGVALGESVPILTDDQKNTYQKYQMLAGTLASRESTAYAAGAGGAAFVPGAKQISDAVKNDFLKKLGNSDPEFVDAMLHTDPLANAKQAHPGAFAAGNLAVNAALLPAGGAGLKALGIESQLLRDGVLFGVLGGAHTGFEQDWSKPIEASGKTLLSAGLNAVGGAVAGKVNEDLFKAISDEWNGVGKTIPEFVDLPPETPESDTSLPDLVKDWNGGYTEGAGETQTKPYSTNRPKYGRTQVDDVWNAHADPETGTVTDPSGATIVWDRTKPRNGQWDMGHIPGQKYSTFHEKYMNGEISLDEFLKWYRNPLNYRPELPETNRGHLFEGTWPYLK